MNFPERLAAFREEQGLTQQALAERVAVRVSWLRRYEGGGRNPASKSSNDSPVAVAVSADRLVFDNNVRWHDDDLLQHLEAIQHLSDDASQVVKIVIERVLLRSQAGRCVPAL